MGSNYSSEENVHNTETHEQLQKSINNLLNLSNSSKSNRTINTVNTDTNMTFNKNDISVSTPVTEILKDITEFDQVAQTGGGAQDKLTVIPTRMRYGLPIKFDAGINRQVNKNLLQDEIFIGGNDSKLSVKSDNNFSATSKESKNVFSATSKESNQSKNVFSATSKNSKSTFSSTSISDKDFQILKNVVLKHSQNGGCGLTQTAAGCGCGGSDTKLSITSENPIRYDAMMGGNDKVAAEAAEVKKEKKVKKEEEDEDEDLFDDDDDKDDDKDEDDEDEVSSSDKSTTEGTKSVSDNSTTDKSTATTETTESAKSSEQSRAKGRKAKKTAKKSSKKSKKTKKQKGGTTTETQLLNNIDINTKYLYSSNNNTQFETENQSEYYKTYKNRSLIN